MTQTSTSKKHKYFIFEPINNFLNTARVKQMNNRMIE